MQIKSYFGYHEEHKGLYRTLFTMTQPVGEVYDNYADWFKRVFVPGLKKGERGYIVAKEEKGRVVKLLSRAGLPVQIPEYIDRAKLVKKLYTDKKTRNGTLRFVIQKGIGTIVEFSPNVFATPIEESVAREIIFNM